MTPRRSDRVRSKWLVIALAMLTGCAQVSFKRGASPDQMTTGEQECRRRTTDEAAFVECMRQGGWFVLGTTDGSPAPATVTPAPEAAVATPERTAASPKPAPIVPEVPEAAATPAPTVIMPAPVVAPVMAPAEAATEPSPGVDSPADDPLRRVDVGSWWKLGGTVDGLQKAAESCTAKLGPAHRPEGDLRIVTAAMRDCLRAAGWYPLGGAGPR